MSALRQISTLFQARLNKPGAPTRVVNTSQEKIVRNTSPPRVETPVTLRAARKITALSSRLDTLKIYTHHTIFSQQMIQDLRKENQYDPTEIYEPSIHLNIERTNRPILCPRSHRRPMQVRGKVPTRPMTIFANDIIDPTTGSAMEHQHLMEDDQHEKVRKHSFSNEVDSLEQGVVKRVKGTNTILFINYEYIPSKYLKYITYGCILSCLTGLQLLY